MYFTLFMLLERENFQLSLESCLFARMVTLRHSGNKSFVGAGFFSIFEQHKSGSLSYQARAQSARARRACALRALGLFLADGTPTVGGGKTF